MSETFKVGRSRVISPQVARWDDLFESGPRASEDFMSKREEPAVEHREALSMLQSLFDDNVRRSRTT